MKKVISIILALITVVSLCACGAGPSPEPQKEAAEPMPEIAPAVSPSPTVAPTPDVPSQEEKNGFDEATNTELILNGISFSIPDYWGEPEKNDKICAYKVKNCGFVLFMIGNNDDSVSLSSASDDEKKAVVKELLGKFDLQTADIALAEYSFLDMDTFGFNSKASSGALDYDVCGATAADANTIMMSVLCNLRTSPYSIKDDYYRVLRSAKRVEKEASSGIRPELKEALDSYEAFIDQYVDFMNSYMQNPTDFSLLAGYMDFLTKYQQMSQSIENMDQGEMNNEELSYYIDVTARISKKLLGIIG